MIKNLTKTELEVLGFFINYPTREIHVRGLSKELDLPYSSVRNGLETLEQKSILEKDEKSKMTFYRSGGEKFRKIKKIINLEKIETSGIVEKIEEKLRPEAVVLFGSFLEGRDDEESDIDIAVINGRNRETDLSRFEDDLNRSIHLINIQNIMKEEKEFRNSLANGYILQGYLEID